MSGWTAHQRGVAATVLAAIVWSTAGLFIKLLSQDALTILCYRAFYTAMVFAIVYRADAFIFSWAIVRNALLYTGLLLSFVSATKLTTAANAIFLQYTGVAFILLLEPIIARQRHQLLDIMTMLVCFIGMSLFFADNLGGFDGWGVPIAALSGLFFAAFFLGQRFAPPSQHVAAIFWGNVLVMCIGLPSFWHAAPPTLTEHSMLLFLGIIQMGLGYILFTYGLKRISATEASLISMLEPLFNPVWVLIGYGEVPSTLAVVGGLVIIGALMGRIILKAK